MSKTLRIRQELWDELERLRVALRLANADEVLHHLVAEAQEKPRASMKGPDPLLSLAGLGREVWNGVDPYEYVRRLRRSW